MVLGLTMTRTGLAFSGGGIRSAAFCSGVLRRLLESEVEVDYLSCVSGGGYTGTAYLDWKYREERRKGGDGEARRDWHKEFFEHMRDRTGYVCNWKKPFQGIFDTIILSCLVIAVAFVQPLIIWGSYACPIAFMIYLLFGKYLRDKVNCDAETNASAAASANMTDAALSDIQAIRRHCLARQGTDKIYTVILFAVLFLLFISFNFLNRLNRLSPLQSFFVRLSQYTFGAFLLLTSIPFSIHDFYNNIPLWAKILLVPLCIIVWLVLPLLRSKTSYVMIIFFYSYVTHWKVYEGKEIAIGIMFSYKLFHRLLFASGFVLWIVPIVAALHERLVHIYNRWRLQRAFYHRQGVGPTGCAGIGLQDTFALWTCLSSTNQGIPEEEKPLTLADLKGMKPEYLANIVVNRWKKSKLSQHSYELLTMSPTGIERIDRDPNNKQFKGKLEPEDVKLSDAMATSAAALSTHMGKYDYTVKGLTRLHTILGLEMGATTISDIKSVRRESCTLRIFLPCVVDVLRCLPLIVVPALYHGSEPSVKIGVIIFFAVHLVLVFIALIDTGAEQPGWLEKVARWFIVHISFVYFVREMFSKENIGPMPPPILLLSDGGHIENLAILPLLKRRLRRIVVVDGGYKNDDQYYGDSLLNALMLAHTKLNCSFLSEDGQDVIFNLLETFVRPKTGGKPHYYKFKVRYQSDEFGEEGEGEILLIVPRDPQHGVSEEMDGNRSTNLHPFDAPDGVFFTQDEVNKLTLCCCECCHRQACQSLSKICCNVFPQHSTANQFFTSRMFSAYHCEGYRACVDANAVGFLRNGDREREQNYYVNINV
ncbi:uncharacterized protein LOC144647573 [Oculina patagonica]